MGLPERFTALPIIPMPPALCSSTVVRDCGFAQNPFREFCNLATCKPYIRRLQYFEFE